MAGSNNDKIERTLAAVLGRGEEVELEAGERWMLFPLTNNDLADMEEWQAQHSGIGDIGIGRAMLWMSLRKNGLTAAKIRARQWELTIDDVGFLLPLRRIDELCAQLMRISGARNDEEKKRKDPEPGLGSDLVRTSDEARSDSGGVRRDDAAPEPVIAPAVAE